MLFVFKHILVNLVDDTLDERMQRFLVIVIIGLLVCGNLDVNDRQVYISKLSLSKVPVVAIFVPYHHYTILDMIPSKAFFPYCIYY